MAISDTFQYNGTFSGNISVVGQTDCEKTSFVQSLGKNKIFGDELLSVDWLSKINLTKITEDGIRQYFIYTIVNFHYSDDTDEFELLLEKFQRDTIDNDEDNADKDVGKCNISGENKKFDKFIVMDNVSGLAVKSNDFGNILTISRKFGYIFQYIFHIIYPTKSIWQMILSQTKIFNIFFSSVQLGNMLKILTNNCGREKIKCIPARDLWQTAFTSQFQTNRKILAWS